MLVSWSVRCEGRVVGWVSGLGSKTVGLGFWFRGLGLLWARVMCWKRERDDEVERERSERDGRWNGHGGCKVGREDSRVWEW